MLGAADPRAQQGQRLGLGIGRHARLLRGRDRRRLSLFVRVEQRATAPLVDLKLLRNRVLVGATLAILIVAGTINGLMYVLSLYFQNPAALGMSAFEAGLATLPAAAAMIAITPADHAARGQDRRRAGGRARVRCSPPSASRRSRSSKASWAYAALRRPAGRARRSASGFANGPASSGSTAAVSADQVGQASGISNMARYVGAAVAVAAVAMINNAVAVNHQEAGESASEALAAGLGASALAMAILVRRRRRARRLPAPLQGAGVPDPAIAAAISVHTIPIEPSPPPREQGASMPVDELPTRGPGADGPREGRPGRARLLPVGRRPQAVPARGVREGRRSGSSTRSPTSGCRTSTMSPTPDGSTASTATRRGPRARRRCSCTATTTSSRRSARTRGRRRSGSSPSATAAGTAAARPTARATSSCTSPRCARCSEVNGGFPCGVKLICEGSEEQGTGGLEAFVPENAELLRADTILVVDTGNFAVGVPTLTTTLRGHDERRRHARRGLGSAMHSGMFGGPAPDPLRGAHPDARHAARRARQHDRRRARRDRRRGPASTTPPSSSAATPTCSTASS